jgi:hypothetical protein
MTLSQQVNQMNATNAVALSMSVCAMNLTVCTVMRTDRKHIMHHNRKRTCGNCNWYIYEDQDWILIDIGFGRQDPFHADYQGCMDSRYIPEIRIGTRKGKRDD